MGNGTAHSEATASGDLRSKRSWSKGNPECALDITFQRKNLPSLFNALLTQSLSTMSALKTLALRMQMSSGTKFSAISNLSTPRSAPNITNTSKKSRANETNRIRDYVHYVVKYLNFENNLIYMNTREDRFRARGTFISFDGGISSFIFLNLEG